MTDDLRHITLRDARENNLKGVSLSIPHGKLVVFTGPSGSGKSSLVFDTLAAEAARQLANTFPPYLRARMPRYEPPRLGSLDGLTASVVIGQRPFVGDVRSTVGTLTGGAALLRLLFSRCAEPRLPSSACFSFNDPQGMCPECAGLGSITRFGMGKVLDRSLSLNEGAIRLPGHGLGTYQWQLYAHSGLYDPDKPIRDFTPEEYEALLHGSGVTVDIVNTTGKVWDKSYKLTYEGLEDRITRLYLRRDVQSQSKANQRIIEQFTRQTPCPVCGGARLNAAARSARLQEQSIMELSALEARELVRVLEELDDPVGRDTAQSLCGILRSMDEVGLGYLSLGRPATSLSGGEAQRLRIVRCMGSSLTGMTYIFDEPSTGLHPVDVARLGPLLCRLRDRGNTVLVVEHDRELIRLADHIIELGPGAGRFGGEVVFEGSFEALCRADTATGRALREGVRLNRTPRQAASFLSLEHLTLHNLTGFSVQIPCGVLTAVSGPAGAGKTTLMQELLARYREQTVFIDQSPIGVTSRSNPASYIGIADEIRKRFARATGVRAALFSYNSEGACPVCGGKGEIRTEMAFMDPITVTCECCGGSRFSAEALRHRVDGKNILDVLHMTAEEAAAFFPSPAIREGLGLLQAVGLGYLTLGQPVSTLSGGECQRLKLAAALRQQGKICILDEPSTGLHAQDVQRLLALLQSLVEQGHTVILVEHNLDLIAAADYVIDLGPGGGKHGGMLMFAGAPSALLDCQCSVTAEFLRRQLPN